MHDSHLGTRVAPTFPHVAPTLPQTFAARTRAATISRPLFTPNGYHLLLAMRPTMAHAATGQGGGGHFSSTLSSLKDAYRVHPHSSMHRGVRLLSFVSSITFPPAPPFNRIFQSVHSHAPTTASRNILRTDQKAIPRLFGSAPLTLPGAAYPQLRFAPPPPRPSINPCRPYPPSHGFWAPPLGTNNPSCAW